MDFYIYYQVKDADADSSPLRSAVGAMQAMLARSHGVACQLKRRPQAQDGLQTWMEIYAGAPAGFESVLSAAVVDAGLAAWIAGPRHSELFTDIAPCA